MKTKSWKRIRCSCGAISRVSPLLEGGPIPCAECGRICRIKPSSKDTGSGPNPRAAALPFQRRSLRARRDPRSYSPALAAGVVVATVLAYVLNLAGPDPTPAWAYVFGTLCVLVIDLALLALASFVLRLDLGTIGETSLKVLLIMQLLGGLVMGAELIGPVAVLFVVSASLLIYPSLFVSLFGWNWGEAILVFLAQLLCHYGVLSYLEQLS